MQTYDFVWQPIWGGLPFDRARFEAALTELGVTRRAEGAWVWKLSRGETVITALHEGGTTVGFDVRVPLSDSAGLVLETLEKGVALATSATLQFVDPQLSRPVTERDTGAVEESFFRVAAYAGAADGASGATFVSAPPLATGLTPPVKLALALLVFVAAFYFAFQMVAVTP